MPAFHCLRPWLQVAQRLCKRLASYLHLTTVHGRSLRTGGCYFSALRKRPASAVMVYVALKGAFTLSAACSCMCCTACCVCSLLELCCTRPWRAMMTQVQSVDRDI